MNIKTFIPIVAALLLSACSVTVKHVEETPSSPSAGTKVLAAHYADLNSLQYALPNTGLRFVITSEKVVKSRGEFYLYSDRFLGLKDIIREDATEWRIKDVKLVPFGEANPDEMFYIDIASDATMPSLQLADDGVLLSVNSDVIAAQAEDQYVSDETVVPALVPYTESMMLANSTAKMADEAARYIYQLRESRTALLSSELDVLPPDGQAYTTNLTKIDELESQFVSLFKGTETVTSVVDVLEIVPEEVMTKEVLFRFASFGGVVDKEDLSGSPIHIMMDAKDFVPSSTEVADSSGLFFKRPAPFQVKLMAGKQEILSQKVFLAQFGELQALPIGTLDDDIKIQMNSSTGAIKAILK